MLQERVKITFYRFQIYDSLSPSFALNSTIDGGARRVQRGAQDALNIDDPRTRTRPRSRITRPRYGLSNILVINLAVFETPLNRRIRRIATNLKCIYTDLSSNEQIDIGVDDMISSHEMPQFGFLLQVLLWQTL